MKFKVKAGREFDGEFVLDVEVEPEKQRFSFRSVLIGTAIGTSALLVLVGFVWGISTGDYAILKAIAQYGKELLSVAVKAALKSE